MRYLFALISVLTVHSLMGQACKMPLDLDVIRPEKCGIRYVETEGDQIKVILEFEKKARILTPDDPNDVKGRQVTLIGLYYLTYDQQGEILEEDRVFVQTGVVPDRGLVFGLKGQYGQLIESDLKLISVHDYHDIPIAPALQSREIQEIAEPLETEYYESSLNVDGDFKLSNLHIVRWVKPDSAVTDELKPISKLINLETFDSCTKKNYWTNLYLPATDPAEGFTLSMLNKYDRGKSKKILENQMQLVSFDTAGLIAGQHSFDFPSAMKIAHREEIFTVRNGRNELAKQIWVLTPKDELSGQKQFYYYSFDKRAGLLNSAVLVSPHELFEAHHMIRHGEGEIYMSSEGMHLVNCYVGYDGAHKVSTTGSSLAALEHFVTERSKNGNNIQLSLQGEPERLSDSTILVIYQVEENVGLHAAVQVEIEGVVSNKVSHGFIVAQMKKNGEFIDAEYYQRPDDADPKKLVKFGPIQENDKGWISFYAQEKTSAGIYPVFCNIKNGEITFVKNENGASSARGIYFDAENAIVSYFGYAKDPKNPSQNIRTLEVLVGE